jgi:hypothetical protein
VAATSDTLSITVRDPDCKNPGAIPTSVPCIVRKSTPFGLLEFDATGGSRWDEERLTFTVTREGTQRRVQRRAACRIELRSEARFTAGWPTAAASGRQRNCATFQLAASRCGCREALDVGRKVLIEFSLNDMFFLPSVVRRIEGRSSDSLLYALEYLEPGDRLQDRLAKAISQLQVRIIWFASENRLEAEILRR